MGKDLFSGFCTLIATILSVIISVYLQEHLKRMHQKEAQSQSKSIKILGMLVRLLPYAYWLISASNLVWEWLGPGGEKYVFFALSTFFMIIHTLLWIGHGYQKANGFLKAISYINILVFIFTFLLLTRSIAAGIYIGSSDENYFEYRAQSILEHSYRTYNGPPLIPLVFYKMAKDFANLPFYEELYDDRNLYEAIKIMVYL